MQASSRLQFFSNRLYFKKPFGISKLRRDYQDVIRVQLKRNGIVALGETSAIPYYGLKIEEMLKQLQAVRSFLEHVSWAHPEEFYEILRSKLRDHSFLRAALDAAAWNWYSQSQGRPIWQLIGFPDPAAALPTNYTIGLDSPEKMLADIQAFPWGCC